MIKLKSEKEIEIMIEGGKRLKKVVEELLPFVKEDRTTEEIDKKAEFLIKKQEGESSFKRVEGYHWTTCLSINEQIVHTIPSSRVLKKGDLLTIDIGFLYKGYHSDYAMTIIIGDHFNDESVKFLTVGKKALSSAISEVKIGNRIGHISSAISSEIGQNGYFVIRELTGHGIGTKLHEDPLIPGYIDIPIEKTPMIKNGIVLAIEIIYSKKKTKIEYENDDGWSLITANRSLAACFEHTVAVYQNKALILT